MKKLKKFLYPPIFVAGFFVWSFFAVFAVGIIDTIRSFEGYGALAVVLLAVFAYVLLGLPLYCVRYSKIIIDEKLNFLFMGYNLVALETACFLTVRSFRSFEKARIAVSLWILFWSVIPFLLRLLSKKRNADPTKSDLPSKTAFLFRNKTKHVVAICFVSLYVVNLLTDSMVLQFYELSYFIYFTLPAISAVFVLVFLLTKNKSYILKDYMLLIALALEAVTRLFSICVSLPDLGRMVKHDPLYPVSFVLSFLITVSVILMLVGTLFDFKHIKLLKFGSLACVVLCGARLVLELVELFFANRFIIDYLLAFLTRTLYFAGIYILTTNEKSHEF